MFIFNRYIADCVLTKIPLNYVLLQIIQQYFVSKFLIFFYHYRFLKSGIGYKTISDVQTRGILCRLQIECCILRQQHLFLIRLIPTSGLIIMYMLQIFILQGSVFLCNIITVVQNVSNVLIIQRFRLLTSSTILYYNLSAFLEYNSALIVNKYIY